MHDAPGRRTARILALVTAFVLAVPGVALAGLPYETGQWVGGVATTNNYLHGKKPLVVFDVKVNEVVVTVLRYRERCSNGKTTFVSINLLRRAPQQFQGAIQANGHFMASVVSHGKTTLRGTLKGSAGTVIATDKGPLPSNPKIICRAPTLFTRRDATRHGTATAPGR